MLYPIDIQIEETYQARIDGIVLQSAAVATLHRHGISKAALTIVVTTDETVQSLNQQYRGIDKPTDVLSFANQNSATQEMAELVLPKELVAEQQLYLGDIIIAYPYAARQAAHYQNSIATELRLLVVHGLLHLLGYDHAAPDEKTEMWKKQADILNTLGEVELANRFLPTE